MTRYCICKRNHGRRPDRGFTLTEIMMALFILSMVMAGVFSAFIACQKLWHSTSLDCASSNEGSMALERFVYGDGWTPGLRAAYADSISVASTGSSWVLTYSTPDTTNNCFAFDSVAKILSFRSGDAAQAHAAAMNVTSADLTPDSDGIRLSIQLVMTEGMFSSTNNFSTYVCYRN